MGYRQGVALVIGAGILWSFMGLIVRQIDGAGAVSVVFWRSAGMAPVILGFLILRRGRGTWASLRATGMAGVIAGLGISLAYLGAIYALQATTVANAVFLFSAAPFFSAVLGRVVLGERVSSWTWAAMALAGLGIFVMIGGSLGGGGLGGGGRMDGNLAALASAFGFAVFTVALRSGRIGDMMPANLLGAGLSMLAAALLAPALGQTLVASPRDIAIAMAMGAVVLAGGMILFTFGSRRLPAAEATLFSSVENILAPVWVWALLGETATLNTLIGGAMVLGAVILNAYRGALGATLAGRRAIG